MQNARLHASEHNLIFKLGYSSGAHVRKFSSCRLTWLLTDENVLDVSRCGNLAFAAG